jgi:hypothetical protein
MPSFRIGSIALAINLAAATTIGTSLAQQVSPSFDRALDCRNPQDAALCREIQRDQATRGGVPPSAYRAPIVRPAPAPVDRALDCRNPQDAPLCAELGPKDRSAGPPYRQLAPQYPAPPSPARSPPSPAASTAPISHPALVALEQVAGTMANSNSEQLLQTLNVSVSPNARTATEAQVNIFTALINCEASAVKRGSRSAVQLLRNECARAYLDWFPTCTGRGETATACAVTALMTARTAMEGFEKYCLGAISKEEESRLGCREASTSTTGTPLANTPPARNQPNEQAISPKVVGPRTQEPEPGDNHVKRDLRTTLANAQLNQFAAEAHLCLRDAITMALRSGQRDRDRVEGFALGLCKAQVVLLDAHRVIAGITQKTNEEERKAFLSSFVSRVADEVLHSGR